MKNLVLLILFCAALSCELAAVNPPGTKKIKIDNVTIYLDQEEIKVADWMEYIYFLEHNYGKDSEELKSAYPEGFSSKEMMSKIKLTKPITGITHKQAKQYCQWRTDIVNSVRTESGLGIVNYTLPTEEQYTKIINIFGAYEILSDKNKTERITGLQSSVYEMTDEGSVLKNNGTFSTEEKIPSKDVGFRCIATIEKQKR